jgi:hypothetical protein
MNTRGTHGRISVKAAIVKMLHFFPRRRSGTLSAKLLLVKLRNPLHKSLFRRGRCDPERILDYAVRTNIGQSKPILAGGETLLKPALSLITSYRLVIEEVKDSEAITSYTPVGGIRAGNGSGKSESLSDIQSALRTHLAGAGVMERRVAAPVGAVEVRPGLDELNDHVETASCCSRPGAKSPASLSSH